MVLSDERLERRYGSGQYRPLLGGAALVTTEKANNETIIRAWRFLLYSLFPTVNHSLVQVQLLITPRQVGGFFISFQLFLAWFRHQKCMRFNPDATVWIAKQRILCSLNQSLKDVLNYGLFQPPSDGRDGKFLDEERLLREYPQPISKGVPALEVGRILVLQVITRLKNSLRV